MNSRMRCFKNVITSKSIGKNIPYPFQARKFSYPSWSLFNPSTEHQALRDMVRSFVDAEVEPQAMEFNKQEKFNIDLFRKLGDLGLLGVTVEAQYGGSEMDAVAAVIVHGKL
jgi:isovaleryl-CoA dehydrogenase